MHEDDAVDLDHRVAFAQPAPVIGLRRKRELHFDQSQGCGVEKIGPERARVEFRAGRFGLFLAIGQHQFVVAIA